MLDQVVFSEAKEKQDTYDALMPQIECVINKQKDVSTNLNNVLKVLQKHIAFDWAGFYHIGEEEFILGPHIGSQGCDHLPINKGACGLAYLEERSVVVDDIEQFVGHLFCEEGYRSEIVLPLFKQGDIILLFNAKSNKLDYFSKVDMKNMAIIMDLIEAIL